jgi:hypothetical protein
MSNEITHQPVRLHAPVPEGAEVVKHMVDLEIALKIACKGEKGKVMKSSYSFCARHEEE